MSTRLQDRVRQAGGLLQGRSLLTPGTGSTSREQRLVARRR